MRMSNKTKSESAEAVKIRSELFNFIRKQFADTIELYQSESEREPKLSKRDEAA